jgi:hypothetical protein
MSEENKTNPEEEFLTSYEERLVAGTSAYGDLSKSLAGQAKLEEVRARLAFGRQQGDYKPAPEPWSPERVAKEKLAQEFPFGPPTTEFPAHLAEHFKSRIEILTQQEPRQLARLTDAVASEIADRPSRVSVMHGRFDRATGTRPGGHEIVRGLLEDAAPVIAAQTTTLADRDKLVQALRADRQLLEHFAARGQEVAQFAASKKAKGIKS